MRCLAGNGRFRCETGAIVGAERGVKTTDIELSSELATQRRVEFLSHNVAGIVVAADSGKARIP